MVRSSASCEGFVVQSSLLPSAMQHQCSHGYAGFATAINYLHSLYDPGVAVIDVGGGKLRSSGELSDVVCFYSCFYFEPGSRLYIKALWCKFALHQIGRAHV